MKKLFIYTFIASLVIAGCGKNDKTAGERASSEQSEKTAALMESQTDSFNPKSKIESSDKIKLTEFGMRKTPMPEVFINVQKAQLALNKTDMAAISISSYESKRVLIPSFPFDYENDIDVLKKLYKSHELDKIIKPGMRELDKLKALMLYTYNFFQGGKLPSVNEDYGPSAEHITKLRQEKGIGGSSRQYAALFCQLALSCGFNSRLVSMHGFGKEHGIINNDVCEVFLNDFDKWAVFDSYSRATMYFSEDVPQSALELRNMMLYENYASIRVDSGAGDFTEIIDVREKLLPSYRYIYMWRMNDILSKSPVGGSLSWIDLYKKHLVWEDEFTPVSTGEFDKIDKFGSDNPVKFVTHNKDDLYWPLNHVEFSFERMGDDKIIIYFNTVTPNFAGFKIFDSGVYDEKVFDYKMKGLLGDFKVQSYNSFGVLGPVSTMHLTI